MVFGLDNVNACLLVDGPDVPVTEKDAAKLSKTYKRGAKGVSYSVTLPENKVPKKYKKLRQKNWTHYPVVAWYKNKKITIDPSSIVTISGQTTITGKKTKQKAKSGTIPKKYKAPIWRSATGNGSHHCRFCISIW